MHPSNRRIAPPKLPDVVDIGDAAEGMATLPAGADGKGRRAPWLAAAARTALGFALVIGVSWAVAAAARSYVMTSPRFAVTEIVIRGAKLRSEDFVAREAGLEKGKNVFLLDLDQAHAELARDPWLRDVALARRLPGTILVQVTEREAAAIVALGESYLASREGEVFKRLEPGDPSDLPVITGLGADAVADDREGVARSIRRALDLAGDYEHGPLGSKAPIQEIHLASDGTTTLIVGKAGLALALGDPPFRKKLDEAARVIGELERRGAKADAILLDNEARPERVVVRMR